MTRDVTGGALYRLAKRHGKAIREGDVTWDEDVATFVWTETDCGKQMIEFTYQGGNLWVGGNYALVLVPDPYDSDAEGEYRLALL